MSLHRSDAVADAAGPVAETARQPLLDLLRGFALLGVFMMNIDFFARPLLDFSTGMAAGEGLDAVAAWLVSWPLSRLPKLVTMLTSSRLSP